MKKLICILLALLFVLPCAMAEPETDVALVLDHLFTRADGTAVLHLVFHKTGPQPVYFQDLGVRLLDASGAAIAVTDMEAQIPLPTVPAGEHYIPVIITATLPEGASAADFRLSRLDAVETDHCSLTLPPQTQTYFMMEGSRHPELTVCIEQPAETLPNQFMGYALIFGRSEEFLGIVPLTEGTAEAVAGNDLLAALSGATGMPQEHIRQMGFTDEMAVDSILFPATPMAWLPEGAIPAGAYITLYQADETARKRLSIADMDLNVDADGHFELRAMMRNDTQIPLELTEVGAVALQDETGRTIVCREYEWDAPVRTVAPGDSLLLIITGQAEIGFDAVACGFSTDCIAAEPAE